MSEITFFIFFHSSLAPTVDISNWISGSQVQYEVHRVDAVEKKMAEEKARADALASELSAAQAELQAARGGHPTRQAQPEKATLTVALGFIVLALLLDKCFRILDKVISNRFW